MGWRRQAAHKRSDAIRCPETGKISYGTRNKAIKALDAINNSASSKRNAERVYYCQSCGGYHVTSAPFLPNV